MFWSAPTAAQFDYTATLLGAGDDERIDGAGGCPHELDFIAGVPSPASQLQVGGNGYGCDSEWGAYAEFDFSAIGASGIVMAASLTVRYTGYGDDAAGLPYVGLYDYAYAGGPVALPRADLDEFSGLAVFAPTSATNVDFTFDVTDVIIERVQDETRQAGFFLCGAFNEVGYNDLVYFGGSSHSYPPRLVITTAQPVTSRQVSWGAVKAVYR
jgi:hypothetical protein